jgi:hypothetical protein
LTVDNGLRVWKKNINSMDSWYSGIVYGCSGIVPASLQVEKNQNVQHIPKRATYNYTDLPN